MANTLTDSQIQDLATQYNVDYAAIRAVIQVESSGHGFLSDGNPTILFEPHIFWRELDKKNYTSLKLKMQKVRPDLVYPKWHTYPYGATSAQPQRLNDAINLIMKVCPNLDASNPSDAIIIDNCREAAQNATSWGLGQVLGLNWQALGYDSSDDFVQKMRESEANQLDAVLRFCKMNNLLDNLQSKDWAGFARGYNGANYAQNRYDSKLQAAYTKFNTSNTQNA